MTTVRLYQNLKPVKPTQALIISPCPCEETTAAIRNKAVEGIQTGNAEEVSLRYLQSRDGENKTFYQALIYAVAILLIADQIRRNPTPMTLFTCIYTAVFLAANIPPNICNTLRYKATKNACESWLNEKLEASTFQQIKELGYSGKMGYMPGQMWIRPCKTRWKKNIIAKISHICKPKESTDLDSSFKKR